MFFKTDFSQCDVLLEDLRIITILSIYIINCCLFTRRNSRTFCSMRNLYCCTIATIIVNQSGKYITCCSTIQDRKLSTYWKNIDTFFSRFLRFLNAMIASRTLQTNQSCLTVLQCRRISMMQYSEVSVILNIYCHMYFNMYFFKMFIQFVLLTIKYYNT